MSNQITVSVVSQFGTHIDIALTDWLRRNSPTAKGEILTCGLLPFFDIQDRALLIEAHGHRWLAIPPDASDKPLRALRTKGPISRMMAFHLSEVAGSRHGFGMVLPREGTAERVFIDALRAVAG